MYPPPYPIYQQPQQPQIIMMPPYQLPQTQSSPDTTNQLKYLERMMELKNEENKRLMEMIMRSRDEKQNFKKTVT